MEKTAKVTHSGFSLIELLIVIGILAIISAIGVSGFSMAQKRARDAGRKSDLAQFRSSLESYANNNNGLYLTHATVVNADTICGASDLNLGFSCPVDVKSATSPYGYKYISDASATRYALYAYLEVTSNYWAMCSNGNTLSKATAPVVADCP